jgi:hypothetical protein
MTRRLLSLGSLLLASPALGQISACVGTYSGTWQNLTFSSSGPITATVALNAATLSITFDPDGGVFGLTNPPAATIMGPIAAGNWSGSLSNHATYGNLTASINGTTGATNISGTNVPSPFVLSYTAAGTLNACALQLNGTIQLEPSGTAQTVISATKVCYPNCDSSTTAPVLNVGDFTCFLQRFAAGASYANCDNSTTVPVLNVGDFTCFLQRFAAGCS